MKYKLINDDQQKTLAIILKGGEEAADKIMTFSKEQKLSVLQFLQLALSVKLLQASLISQKMTLKKFPLMNR